MAFAELGLPFLNIVKEQWNHKFLCIKMQEIVDMQDFYFIEAKHILGGSVLVLPCARL